MSPRKKQALWRYAQYAILVIALLAAIAMADWKTLSTRVFNLDVAAQQFPEIITVALKNTLLYTVLGFSVGLSGGLLLALMRISKVAPYRWISTLYVEIFRGIPALLVFFAFGYGIPLAFKIRFVDNLIPVTLSLGMVSAAYVSEVLRAGLEGVPAGQYEAARSLGMSHARAMFSIIVPQAFRMVLPPLTNEVILLTKDSSLVYLLGVTTAQYELAKFGREGLTASGAGLTPLVVAGLCYLLITIPLGQVAKYFEMKTKASSRK
ncbi:MAG: amino acid ABC transporter permease [Rothia sp. (in: high G+C Gram-positive bacteria)]|uniref:amino acid ABC transporter permease n=1 Tax=Rothia sp. (in: high G+C Gram-positive bacteria) TaxID=1885016 RepID=UPI0026DF672B|nr:amino acid ABC transporter permease [Rothia sp. (in: high G+C Gram-positive bacteria)]MDO5751140.1 amino acid ABC transporter permease [Rothia sp. (in: high G+C Gram-positive bacteria)]